MVLGAGVVGVTSAWYLAQRGFRVTVLERQSQAAMETSFANGGQISVSHAEPWANPRAPWQALRWLGKEDAPLLFRLRADAAQWRWTWQFLRECRASRYRANIPHIVRLALHSRECLKQLRQQLAQHGGLHYHQLERGILHIYTNTAAYHKGLAAAQLLVAQGCERRPLNAAECVATEPALAAIADRLVGGDFTGADESGDAHVFSRELAARCREAGVEFRFDCEFARLELDRGRIAAVHTVAGERLVADEFVLAAGSYSPDLLQDLGVRLPLYPVKGYSATFSLGADSIAPQVSLIDDEYKLVFSRLGDRLRVAGTAEINGFDRSLNPVRCRLLEARSRELFPQLNDRVPVEFWAGLRPVTPSAIPYIGRHAAANLWLNTGHGTLGWTMACGSADILAARLCGEDALPGFLYAEQR